MRVASRPSSPHNPPPNTGSQYFDRRGEVNELRQALRSGLAERDLEKLKDSVKKVIGYMTLGIDMSRLFSEMVMAAQLGDLVQKKLVYLYITTYAEENSDLAILAVNTLQKDTKDVDPSVRGLALRSLCSLHIPNGWEYFQPAISQGLSDPSPYVRKTAVMSLLKLKEYPETDQFVARVINLLSSDADANVVANCVAVLSELNQLNTDDKLMVYRLLNMFPSFSEYGKSLVLSKVVSKYFPQSDDEMFDLMNILDIHLKQTSVSVSILIMRLFRSWTNSSQLKSEVLLRCKDPLLTLYSSASNCPEMQYAILVELLSIINETTASNEFIESIAPHYSTFLLTTDDSGEQTSCSVIKIEILKKIATNISAFTDPIVCELSQSISSRSLAQHCVNAIVQIISQADQATPQYSGIAEIFATQIDKQLHPSITSACLVGIRNLVSIFPTSLASTRLAELLEQSIPTLADEQEGLAAAISLLAEIDDVDVSTILESVVDSLWDNNTTEPQSRSRIAAIASSVKMFFKFPNPQSKNILERVLYLGIEESTDPDVRDTALFYFRLFKNVGAKELENFFVERGGGGEKMVVATVPPPVDDLLVTEVSNDKRGEEDNSLISF